MREKSKREDLESSPATKLKIYHDKPHKSTIHIYTSSVLPTAFYFKIPKLNFTITMLMLSTHLASVNFRMLQKKETKPKHMEKS